MKKNMIFIILLGMFVAGLAMLFYVKARNTINNMGGRTITIREGIELNENWKEINLEEIKFPEKENNVLSVSSSLPKKHKGFVAPNGEVFLPQIMLENYKGNKCFLEYKVKDIPPQNSFHFKENKECFSKPNTYKKLWVKSPVVFNAKILYWGYNLEDRK